MSYDENPKWNFIFQHISRDNKAYPPHRPFSSMNDSIANYYGGDPKTRREYQNYHMLTQHTL